MLSKRVRASYLRQSANSRPQRGFRSDNDTSTRPTLNKSRSSACQPKREIFQGRYRCVGCETAITRKEEKRAHEKHHQLQSS